MSDRKAVIKNADMSEEMQQDAVDCATQALEKYNIEKVKWVTSSKQHTHTHMQDNANGVVFFCSIFNKVCIHKYIFYISVQISPIMHA